MARALRSPHALRFPRMLRTARGAPGPRLPPLLLFLLLLLAVPEPCTTAMLHKLDVRIVGTTLPTTLRETIGPPSAYTPIDLAATRPGREMYAVAGTRRQDGENNLHGARTSPTMLPFVPGAAALWHVPKGESSVTTQKGGGNKIPTACISGWTMNTDSDAKSGRICYKMFKQGTAINFDAAQAQCATHTDPSNFPSTLGIISGWKDINFLRVTAGFMDSTGLGSHTDVKYREFFVGMTDARLEDNRYQASASGDTMVDLGASKHRGSWDAPGSTELYSSGMSTSPWWEKGALDPGDATSTRKTPWNGGEPNEHSSGEDFVVMFGNYEDTATMGLLNDEGASNTRKAWLCSHPVMNAAHVKSLPPLFPSSDTHPFRTMYISQSMAVLSISGIGVVQSGFAEFGAFSCVCVCVCVCVCERERGVLGCTVLMSHSFLSPSSQFNMTMSFLSFVPRHPPPLPLPPTHPLPSFRSSHTPSCRTLPAPPRSPPSTPVHPSIHLSDATHTPPLYPLPARVTPLPSPAIYLSIHPSNTTHTHPLYSRAPPLILRVPPHLPPPLRSRTLPRECLTSRNRHRHAARGSDGHCLLN
jgi:hypothetical protein